jgi:tRNA threonylcarbamoyladenosine biosynthesis protein TsaB
VDGEAVIILGIETATQQVGCAIGGQEGVLASFGVARGPHHAETLVPSIKFLFEQARMELDEVKCVAVDVGPGLFTGLRVGVATAKAMAMALRVPMIGLSSLDLLAYSVRHTDRTIVPVIDGKRNEVFWARYRHVAGGIQRLSDYEVSRPEDVVAELNAAKEESLLVGDGVRRYASAFEGEELLQLEMISNAHPSAKALVELAQPRALREEFVQPSELEVLYLRKSDAEVNWERREVKS